MKTFEHQSPFQEGDRIQTPDGRHGLIVGKNPDNFYWLVKVDGQWKHESISDFGLKQANLRGKK